MKKALTLFLSVVFVLLCFAGCKNNNDNKTPNVTREPTNTESVLPDKDWGGRELKVTELDSDLESVIDSGDDTSTPISYEVYARNAEIEAKYNFTISTTRIAADDRPSEKVRTEALAGESTYDIVIDSPGYMHGALLNFIFADLNQLQYIDWNAKGWDQKSNDELDICGYRFICTGDLNLQEKAGSSVIYCNRDMLESLTEEDVRQTVIDGDWTIEKMNELMRLAKRIDGATGNTEIYGLVNGGNGVFVNFMTSSFGMKFSLKDDQGVPHISFDETAYFQSVDHWIDEVLKFYANGELTWTQRYSGTKHPVYQLKAIEMFKNGKALFYGGELDDVVDFQRNATFTYTTLPYPIYDTDTQTEYIAARNYSWSGLLAIPYYAKDGDFSAFALQALNERSGKLMHLYVEEKCKIRGSVDEKDYQLMTLALSNSSYDLGVVYDWGALKTWIFKDRYDDASRYQSIPVSGTNTFASLWAMDKDLAHTEVNNCLRTLGIIE